MARQIDPVCKLCRREGMKLYLKGSRCESPKCAIERRNIPSLLVKANDRVAVKNRPRSLQLVRLNTQGNNPPVPDYLERSQDEPPEARVARLPSRGDVDPHIQDIREQLIIEVSAR